MNFKEKYLKEGPASYFIAEIGINHNGHMDLAKRMIDASKEARADAVKFQKRNFKALLLSGVEVEEPTGYLSKDENDFPSENRAFGTWSYPDSRLEFEDEQVLELWEYSESIGLDFIVSPWEEKSVDFLAENNAKVLKLASIDATNYQFCEYIASKMIPTIVSTGMTDYSQMSITKKIFDDAGCPMMFLHCTSAYPSPIEDKHLRCIPIMQNMFNIDIGFSGHAVGLEGTIGAVTLGANVVEKHVSLSRKMSGPDQAASLEFSEFENLVGMCEKIVSALGRSEKHFLPSELALHSILSKRIVAATDIAKGAKITKEMLTTVVTKKEGGLLPDQFYNILGSTAKSDLSKNKILELSDF
jgi:sialic acid synthase SpsE